MSDKLDMIEAALRDANAPRMRQKRRAAKRKKYESEDRAKQAMGEASVILRPAMRKAREWFRRALIPHGMGAYIDLTWIGGVQSATEPAYDYQNDKAFIWLAYEIHVRGLFLRGTFTPESKADCQAEGWRIFGVVVAMLHANISLLPKDLQEKIRAAG